MWNVGDKKYIWQFWIHIAQRRVLNKQATLWQVSGGRVHLFLVGGDAKAGGWGWSEDWHEVEGAL